MTNEGFEKIQPLIDNFVKTWNELWESVKQTVDALCGLLDNGCFETQERFSACRSRRFAIAKKISKCTSMEAKKMYLAPKPIYYARGSC